MRYLIIIIILLANTIMYAQDSILKLYFEDVSFKTYNLEDIEDFSFIDNTNVHVLKIHYDGANAAYYPVEIIEAVNPSDYSA